MKSTSQKLILLSFILAIIAAAAVLIYLQSLKASRETVKKTVVLVAAEAIPARTLIDREMVREIEVTDDPIFEGYIKSYSDIVGKYTKASIMENEGFHKNMLLDKNGDELSIKLQDGHRAVSINVTGASGVSDLLKPNDFVDIVVYLSQKKDGDEVVWPDIARMVLQNIEVLAVDKDLNREEKEDSPDGQKNRENFLVTLSVKTSDVEKLSLAENIGYLKLALRPIKDDQITHTKGATLEELLVDYGGEGGSYEGASAANNISGDYTSYKVKRGDTLRNISLQFYGDKEKYTIIKEANDINDENLILTGEVIKVPALYN